MKHCAKFTIVHFGEHSDTTQKADMITIMSQIKAALGLR